MNLKKAVLILGLAFSGVMVMANYFSPENIHPVLLLLLFCLIFVAVFYFGTVSYHIYANLSRVIINRGELAKINIQPSAKFRKINFVFSVLAVMLLAMQSIKNVSFYEILLFIIIFSVAVVYIVKIK